MPNKKNIKKEKFYKLPRLFFRKQAYDFIQNLGELLSSGLNIYEALESILTEVTSSRMKRVVEGIRDDIKEGSSLADSLEKRRVLGANTLYFIKIGEQSGRLVENLRILIVQNEKELLFKSKINSALMYASIVVFLTVAISTAVSWYVLPKIADVYTGLSADLPFLTRALIFLGIFLAKYGYIIIPLFFSFGAIIFYFLFSFPKTRIVGHLILFHIPLINKLIKETEISRMGYTLNAMLSGGLPLSYALRALPGTTTFNNYKNFYLYLSKKIEEGHSFQESMSLYKNTNKIIPMSVRQMIAAAEKSGTLSTTFFRIGKTYEDRLEVTSRNLPIILEPILLIIIGIGVAIFVLGTMLPIYNLSNIIGV